MTSWLDLATDVQTKYARFQGLRLRKESVAESTLNLRICFVRSIAINEAKSLSFAFYLPSHSGWWKATKCHTEDGLCPKRGSRPFSSHRKIRTLPGNGSLEIVIKPMTPVAWHYLALLQELSGDLRKMQSAVGPLSNLPAAARLEGDVLEGIAGVTSLFEAFRYMDLPWRGKSETPKARAKDHTFIMPVRPSVLYMSGLLGIFRWQRWFMVGWGGNR